MHPILTVESAGPTLQVFVNGEQTGLIEFKTKRFD